MTSFGSDLVVRRYSDPTWCRRVGRDITPCDFDLCRNAAASLLALSAFFFVLCFHGSVAASGVHGVYQENGAPFLLYDAPALMSLEEGIPVGCEVRYFSRTNHAEGRIAFVKSLGMSGFSLGFLSDGSSGPTRRISGGAAHQIGRFGFGGVLNVGVRKSAAFSFDAGVGFSAPGDWRLSLLARNIIAPDSMFHDRRRELRAAAGGPLVPNQRIEVNSRIGIYVEDFENTDPGYGGALSVEKHFLTNPSVSFVLGVEGDVPAEGTWSAVAFGGLGWGMNIQRARANFSGVYRYDYYGRESGLGFVLRFDPVAGVDRRAPIVSIELSDTLITRGRGTASGRMLVSLTCTEETGGSGVRKWALVIADRPQKSARIIRSYTGGGMAPSSISWDGRDSGGTLCEPGTYYLRFVAVDRRGNVAKTHWKRVMVE